MTYRVVESSVGADIEAWSSVRLPFAAKGWLGRFRRELNTACRTLDAGPGQILHATYASADRGYADLENVLSYNLETSGIRAAARHGLVLERSFAPLPVDVLPHHYRYRLVDRSHGWLHWTPGRRLGAVRLHAPLEVFSAANAKRWWLTARRGSVTADQLTVELPPPFALRVTLNPPERWRGGLAGLLKTLADGLVAALHAHDGSHTQSILDRAAAIDPALGRDELAALLARPEQAPLGRVRLLAPFGTGLQIHPADDRIVLLDVRMDRAEPPGTVTAEASVAVPVDPDLTAGGESALSRRGRP